MAREFLHRRQRHALGLIRDSLLLGPLRGRDASAKIGELLFCNIDVEGAYLSGGPGGASHDDLPLAQ